MSVPAIRIEPRHWEILSVILKRHVPDCDVWAFGSRVTGRSKPYSDLDLAVAGADPLPISTLAALNSELEDSALPFKVDVLDWAETAPSFREKVQASRVLVQPAEGVRHRAG